MPVERRREVRQKISTPAYASIAGICGGPIVDASEHGIALHSELSVFAPRFADVRLDLLENRSSLVTPARVAWVDGEGRIGIEFLNLTAESRRQLQQWLVLNSLVALQEIPTALEKSNGMQLRDMLPGEDPELEPEPPASPLARAVERALALTRADGAALALSDGRAMVCQATAGDIAPPIGSRLDTESGLAGACIRAAKLLRCDNAASDPYVDRESCRALGIASVMAAPIVHSGSVVGLIEVFSQRACAFSDLDCSALPTVAEFVLGNLQFDEPPPAEVHPEARIEMKQTVAPVSHLESPEQTVVIAPPAAEQTRSAPPQKAAESVPAPKKLESAPPPKKPEPVVAQPVVAAPPSSVPRSPSQPAPIAPLLLDEEWLSAERWAARKRIAFFACLSILLGAVLLFGLGGDLTWNRLRLHARAGQDARPETNDDASTESTPEGRRAVQIESYSAEQLRTRANRGDADAQFALGAKYASGEEVGQNYTEAVKWFTKAAEHRHVLAAATLGAFYWAGRGVNQDYDNAYMWSAIAKASGDEASKYRVAILQARMSPLEVADAERRAAAWLKAHPTQSDHPSQSDKQERSTRR